MTLANQALRLVLTLFLCGHDLGAAAVPAFFRPPDAALMRPAPARPGLPPRLPAAVPGRAEEKPPAGPSLTARLGGALKSFARSAAGLLVQAGRACAGWVVEGRDAVVSFRRSLTARLPEFLKPRAPLAEVLRATYEERIASAPVLPPPARDWRPPVRRERAPAFSRRPSPPRPRAAVRAKPRLRLTPSLYPIVDRREGKDGFQLLGIRRDAAPRTSAFYAAPAAAVRHGKSVYREVAYDASKPLGQRRTIEETRPDGTKNVYQTSPLVFDFNGDGARTSDRRVEFDIDGDGLPDRVNDVSAEDGVLAFDADGDGRSGESGLELLGDAADIDGDGRPDGHADGFAALNALLVRAVRDGELGGSALEAEWLGPARLRRLERAYGLRLLLGGLRGKPARLAGAGVAAVAVSRAPARRARDFDGRGNDVSRQEGAAFRRADGTTGAYEDIWLLRGEPRPPLLSRAD